MFALKSVVTIAAFVTFSATATPSESSLKDSIEVELQNSVKTEITKIVTEINVDTEIALNLDNAMSKEPTIKAEQPAVVSTLMAE